MLTLSFPRLAKETETLEGTGVNDWYPTWNTPSFRIILILKLEVVYVEGGAT